MKAKITNYIVPAVAGLMALAFCVLWAHDHSSGLERACFCPDMGAVDFEEAVDDDEVAVELNEEYVTELTVPSGTLKSVGIRLSSAGETEGTLTLSLDDGTGGVLTGSLPVSAINDSGYTFFDVEGRVTPGLVTLRMNADAHGIQVYNRLIYGDDGILYDGPQVKLTQSSFSERRLQFLILITFAVAALLYLFASRVKPSWEKLFIAEYLLFGVIFMIAFAPLAEPDAGNHFKRVLSITQGHPAGLPSEDGQIGDDISWQEEWEVDDNVNLTLYDAVHDLDFHMDEHSPRRLNFTNIALYSPFSYTAPVIGAFFARLLTDRLMVVLLAARVSNLVITGLLFFLAIRIAPVGKRYILWIPTLPLFMQQAVGVAPDSMLTALSVLLLAISLKYRYSGEYVKTGTVVSLYLLTFLLSQYKIVYLLFALFVFLIPRKCFGSNKRYILHVCFMGSMTALSALIWLKISSGMLSTGYALADSQTAKLFTRPVEYLLAVFRTYTEEGFSYIAQLLGRNLGSFAFTTNPLILLLLFSLFLYEVMAVRRYSTRADRVTYALLTGVMLLTTLLITTAEYIQWNDGINLIKGIQGRYFLPFLFPFFILVCGDDTCIPAADSVPAGSDLRPRFTDSPALYLHWILLLCFVPQILIYYMYGTLQ